MMASFGSFAGWQTDVESPPLDDDRPFDTSEYILLPIFKFIPSVLNLLLDIRHVQLVKATAQVCDVGYSRGACGDDRRESGYVG